VRNFKTFRNLCGEPTLKNTIAVTNMRGRVEKDASEDREKELAKVYFRPALEKNASSLVITTQQNPRRKSSVTS
jgi:hypothetical protein